MIGHAWARDLLTRAAARQMLGHAYLFIGPPSAGKTSLAMYLAGLLVCTSPSERPCGACRGCRGVARSSHPDVRVVERAEDRRDITIDQIREIEIDLSMAPYESSRKFVCVAGAEAMNDSAASALLKTLEEPPAGATLVLAAVDPGALPSTIRSRCQAVTLQHTPARVIARALQADYALDAALSEELAVLARGRPGWAVRAIEAPDMVEREREALRQMASLVTIGPYSRMLAVEGWLGKGTFLESRARALEFLSRLESWWRDALIASQSAALPALARQAIGRVSSGDLGAATIVAFLLKIQQAAARVEANVTPRLALENLLSAMPSTWKAGDGHH